LIALRQGGGRKRILLPRGLHPEYRETLETYLAVRGPALAEYAGTAAEAASGAGDDLACLVAAYPDFFGRIPDLGGAAETVHQRGGLFIVQADPVMLGLFKSPGDYGADLVCAEGQSLGNDLNYGGPGLGIMAATEALTRRLPGRIVGEARDREGHRGYVLTLSAREQHIRREKAVSNICSNQGLASLRACVYLALMGKGGLRKAAELCWHKSHYAAKVLAALPGCAVGEGLFFKEFVLRLPVDAGGLAKSLREKNIVPGLPLSRYFPERKRELLVCVTEKHTKEDIDKLAEAAGQLL
jgi:glycine dehydrogenase subunit 1